MWDIVNGDLLLKVVPEEVWKRRASYQPVDGKTPDPYIDMDGTIYEVVEPSLRVDKYGLETYGSSITYFGTSVGGVLTSDGNDQVIRSHQMTLALGRS